MESPGRQCLKHVIRVNIRDVPGGPVAETLLPIQGGSGFDPWSGN